MRRGKTRIKYDGCVIEFHLIICSLETKWEGEGSVPRSTGGEHLGPGSRSCWRSVLKASLEMRVSHNIQLNWE